MDIPKSSNLGAGLARWCQFKGIDAPTFASHLGFSYMHAWRLLNGKSPVTTETLGRFLLAYGHEAVGELLALADKENPNSQTPHTVDTS